MRSALRSALVAAALVLGAHHVLAGGEHSGTVTFGDLPVPGASVTATAGGKTLTAATDEQGVFQLPDATAGVWTLRVEMLGFQTLTRDITVTAEPQPSAWVLVLKPFEEITRGLPPPPPAARSTPQSSAPSERGSRPASQPTPGRGGFQRAGVTASPAPPAPAARAAAAPADEPAAEAGPGAADGFLINGSVNNGAASPFAQAAAFGNNRRGRGSLFNGGLGVVLGNSAFDSSPFTFGALPTQKPEYNDIRLIGQFGGPLRFKNVLRNGPTLFAAVQWSDDHNSTTQPGVMPTLLERSGDFSRTVDAFGRPVTIVDPLTGQPFQGNVIPASRISPQASSLLGYYPQPNLLAGGGYNFQAPLVTAARQDLITTRVTQPINNRNQLIGLFAYQRTHTDQTTIFGFEDTNLVSGVDTSVTWTRRINQFFSIRPRVQFTQITTNVTPYFANRTNVSGVAGINGNNQDPVNWGPPTLTFSTVAGLMDALPNYNRNRTFGAGGEAYYSRGRHNYTFGGDVRRNHVDILTQQNPRGGFAFTGKLTGLDFADFLLGVPSTSTIAFGNPDKYMRAYSSDAYVTDDMRLSPTFTVQAGVRWEYETPLSELFGRLVNLDVAPGFSAISPVLAGATGSLTGRQYPAALMAGDYKGIQPRVGIAWRPVPGSSLVVRAGYGVYRNSSVYLPITSLLAQQPPLSTAFTISNSLDHPLTLANGFVPPTSTTANTFAVDPDLRVGASQNWQALVQRDLPGSLTVTATYLGTKGSHLLQEFLPNTYPSGAVDPCPSCPSGFIYLTSNGRSTRHAGQFQLRRRLRNGLAASVQYTIAKATDNAAAFAGVSLNGSAVAQDWRNLDAELAPSNFDQRHQVAVQFQYTTGLGVSGGALVDGAKGALLKGWTVTSQLTTGSGLPFTPVYLAPVPGTGVTGSIRPSVTGATSAVPDGYYLNPDAYAAPTEGQWGNAGRNSAIGPMPFNLNAGVARTFQLNERLSFDWRLDFTNVLNLETYTGVNNIFGGKQFGLPGVANTPRKVLSTMRLRF